MDNSIISRGIPLPQGKVKSPDQTLCGFPVSYSGPVIVRFARSSGEALFTRVSRSFITYSVVSVLKEYV